MNKGFTIVLSYYEQPEMLHRQLGYWREYPEDIRRRVSVVIVDDGSPSNKAENVLKMNEGNLPKISLYRITENIPWNHGGARNLGMDRADDGWVLVTDMDHVLTVDSAVKLLEQELDPQMMYRPERYDWLSDNERKLVGRHVNSFVMTRELFWKIGGLDERLTGFWNGCSRPFRKHSKRISQWIDLWGVYLLRFDDAIDEWGREGTPYDIKTNRTKYAKQQQAVRHYTPVTLTQPWEQLI